MKWVWKKETCGWYSHSCFDKLERWQCHFLTQGIQKQITDWGNDDEFHLSMVSCLHSSCWRRQRTLRRWDLSKDSTLETEFHNTILWPLTWFCIGFNSLTSTPKILHEDLQFFKSTTFPSTPTTPIFSIAPQSIMTFCTYFQQSHFPTPNPWLIEIFTFLYYMQTN